MIRVKSSDINIIPTKMFLYVNNEEIEFKSHKTVDFNIPEGKYTFYAKYLWYKSNEITLFVSKDETKEFIITKTFYNLSVISGLFSIITYLLLSPLFEIGWILYLMIFPFLITVYYRTIGWKNFLKIKILK